MKILFLSAANSVHTVKWVNALVKRNYTVYLVYLKSHRNKENSLDKRSGMVHSGSIQSHIWCLTYLF